MAATLSSTGISMNLMMQGWSSLRMKTSSPKSLSSVMIVRCSSSAVASSVSSVARRVYLQG